MQKTKKTTPFLRLLELKGVSIRQVAREKGLEYYSLQKTLKGTRKTRAYQQAWADYFGVSRTALFGPTQYKVIRFLLEREIDNKAAQRREELRKKYLRAA